ncbi:lysophosphatidic acid receptor 5-like protein [Lates japonicus]|uniref:Lysophosphatidic acid receptor 5-like protein n=1 Tax=Lates japonicus TaxID=270547 RepID=A0AAD3RKF6_LATJO|nr:lysophosphatidic acid receptor 5-like protein [Lates japonicus]
MGNSNVTSASGNSSSNDSVGGGSPPDSEHGLLWSFSLYSAGFTEVMTECHVQSGMLGWLLVKILILLTASPANVALLWMLLSRWRTMTPSELLGLNVSVMDVLYCLCLPLDLYTALQESSNTTCSVQEALFSLNIFGCPLLLSFMCVERYVAVARPIAYLRLGRKEYRAALCAAAWTLTLIVALLAFFVKMLSTALCLSILISLLFLVMLLCLLGIVGVLQRRGPAEGSGSTVPLRRRALKNVVAVTVPSVVAYSPVVALVPYMSVIISQTEQVEPAQCCILQVLLLFPNFGLFIGPLFYLSRLRQVSCCRRDQETPSSKTQAE